MAKNRGNNGYQVVPSYSYGGAMIRNAKELDEAIRQRVRQNQADEDMFLESNMRNLLLHLEKGSVFYMTEMAIPPTMDNKQPSTLITLKTLLDGQEGLWIVRRESVGSRLWEVNYTCKGNAFGVFRICASDVVTAVR